MKTINVILSAILGLAIDQALSITDRIMESLEPLMVGPVFSLTKPLIMLVIFLVEVVGVYQTLNKIKIFEKVFK